AVKAVETGVAVEPEPHEDGVRLARATGQAHPQHALHRFRMPVAPAVAAELEGGRLDFDEMVLAVERLAADTDVTLVETAGGLLAPLAWDWTMVDLAETLGATVLVVGANRLGTINHTLLTLGALELGGVQPAGVVLSAPETPDASTPHNGAAIARLSGLERVLELDRHADDAAATRAIEPAVEWILGPPNR
ncbi:MAG TPA: dethiobiotin synthase, partial [Gemmatimonadales bacterium]|nr:dethiobiotin synthase [Gemmatimonadales bacterium]